MRCVLLALLAVTAVPLHAQQQGPDPERLRGMIAERFINTYVQQAGLTDEQHRRFHEIARAGWEARMAADQRRQQLLLGLEGQMRPGVAANADSVARLLDGLVQLEVDRAERAQADMRAYAEFLSPVQRAQLLIMMTRFERQVDQIMRQRMEGHMPPRPRRNNPDQR
jgi:hypothetical protein